MNRSWLAVTLALTLSFGAEAQRVQPTMAGTVVSLNTSTGILMLKLDDGRIKTAHLIPTAHYKSGDRNVTAASFSTPGRKVAIRLCSALNENPLQVDQICDWFSSAQYVATAAPAPYNTRMGDFPTTGGVGGSPNNGMNIARPDHTIGILGNGGKIEQNPLQGMPQNQAAKMAAAQQMMNGGMPGMPGVGDTSMPSSAGIMGEPEEEGGRTAGMGAGVPVNMQAQVLRADPGSHMIQVSAVGSQVPQNVMLAPTVNLPLLKPGSIVTIIGQTNPGEGYIQATNVIPLNPAP